MIVYRKNDGIILNVFSPDQDLDSLYYHYDEDFKNNLDVIYGMDNVDISNYRVSNGKLVRMSDIEINEISLYGKILSSEERLLNEMRPSSKEVKDAEEEIKLLKLLEELI